jgi:hypothetical protein
MASIDQLKALIARKGGIARANIFRVKLPNLSGVSSQDINLLCKDVQLPGRQIMTNDRQIGMKLERIPYNYAVGDVTMTFHVLNDYGIKQYFEAWQNLAVDQNSYEVGYQRGKDGYARNIVIEQLRRGIIQLPTYTLPLGGLLDTPLTFESPDVDFITSQHVIHSVTLENSFPTTLTSIQLNNDLDGIVELSVQLSYTNWRSNLTPTEVQQNRIISNAIGTITRNF